MRICIIVGTRPEIIKMSSLINGCVKRGLDYFVLHTGQHYSYKMDSIFFEELKLPKPKYNLAAGSGMHGKQTGIMLEGIEMILAKEKPSIVFVLGDTNTTLAGALSATKMHINVAHLEAGLRSYDRVMAEETNRVVVDHIADILFTPTEKGKEILLGEGLPEEKIVVSGNTIVDAVLQNLEIAKEKNYIFEKLGIEKDSYFLVTLHRPENVDFVEKLKLAIKGLGDIHKLFNLPIIFSIHPRTKEMIEKFKLEVPKRVKIIEPLGFLEFLLLESRAKLILTDSGGVQEEACILKVPCVTLRDNTERPETIEVGSNMLAGINPANILKCTKKMVDIERKWENPFGDGKSWIKILDTIKDMRLKK